MTQEQFITFVQQNANLLMVAVAIISYFVYLYSRRIIARVMYQIVVRTENVYDDLIVDNLHPFRITLLIPATIVYFAATVLYGNDPIVTRVFLFLVIWILAYTFVLLLNTVNQIYEHSPSYSGVSIEGYIDLFKILIALLAAILSLSALTGQSPVVLLSGLGALTAVLILVFQDTLLSFVASIQIATLDLIKVGDDVSIPAYNADGVVTNVTLHTVTIQNYDKTITTVPTRQITQTAYKNFRGLKDGGGRRIKRSLFLDQHSIGFCNASILDELTSNEQLTAFIEPLIAKAPENVTSITNLDLFKLFAETYLESREDIHQKGSMTFLIRTKEAEPMGLPLEIYVFTKTVNWVEYETIQDSIFSYLTASLSSFELKIFQNTIPMQQ